MRASVEVHFLSGHLLAVRQQTSIATTGSRASCLLDFIVGCVGKTQKQMSEVLAEFVFFSQQLETAPFNGQRRIKNHVSVAHKHPACYFAPHRRYETNRAGPQVKGSGVAP
jgi:hypothetical protein